jgi:SEC-C motif-containing protein
MGQCPCQSTLLFDECCGPIIDELGKAKTPETLMRARYTAYVRSDIDFICESHHPEKRDQFNKEEAQSWSKDSEWLGLNILESSENGDEGEVLFECSYQIENEQHLHRERSSFKKQNGLWYFFDGKLESSQKKRLGPKVGRNEPCPCGSGKKYKKCCLAK